MAVRSPAELAAAARAFFSDFVRYPPIDTVWARPDYYDVGRPYRAVIGVPGGVANARALAVLRRANVHNLTLAAGRGGDADTLKLNKVWIYDSRAFSFQAAEVCMQFHDDQNTKYSPAYHALRAARVAAGTLKPTGCPLPYPCTRN